MYMSMVCMYTSKIFNHMQREYVSSASTDIHTSALSSQDQSVHGTKVLFAAIWLLWIRIVESNECFYLLW